MSSFLRNFFSGRRPHPPSRSAIRGQIRQCCSWTTLDPLLLYRALAPKNVQSNLSFKVSRSRSLGERFCPSRLLDPYGVTADVFKNRRSSTPLSKIERVTPSRRFCNFVNGTGSEAAHVSTKPLILGSMHERVLSFERLRLLRVAFWSRFAARAYRHRRPTLGLQACKNKGGQKIVEYNFCTSAQGQSQQISSRSKS